MRYLIFSILFFVIFSCSKIESSKDQELRIRYIEAPSTQNCAQPFLFAANNSLFMSWTKKINDSVSSLKYSQLIDTSWSDSKEIIKGNDWFVNWADFPAIAENNGNLLSHFLQKSANGIYTYDVRIKLFNKDSLDWNHNFILHSDGTESEHGFVTMLPYKNDSFFVTWLDGRNTSGGHEHHAAGAMTIRAATILENGTKKGEVELDAKTCDCCQTSAAITENGPIVVYRDRSDAEVRDISICRLIDGNWTKSKSIYNDNWKIEGCPVNGPKTAALKNNLAVAWYTAAEEIPKVKLIFSEDNGANFNEPIVIDEVETIGRVDVDFIDANQALISWVTSENNETVIKAVKVHRKGKINNPIVVTTFDPSRSSGFPQMEIFKDKAYFAWTDVSGKNSVIKTVYINLENL